MLLIFHVSFELSLKMPFEGKNSTRDMKAPPFNESYTIGKCNCSLKREVTIL
jgi:hypothetical protein